MIYAPPPPLPSHKWYSKKNSKVGRSAYSPGLQTATNWSHIVTIFFAGASKFCEQSHWRDHRVVQLALPFLLHMRNITWQKKQKRNKTVYQLGLRRKQTLTVTSRLKVKRDHFANNLFSMLCNLKECIA